jgi:hypothetical protein
MYEYQQQTPPCYFISVGRKNNIASTGGGGGSVGTPHHANNKDVTNLDFNQNQS